MRDSAVLHHRPPGAQQATAFDEHAVLHALKHHLPAQAPLKDFIHHNTLHAYQGERFPEALRKAARQFGYKTLLTVNEYRRLYHQGRIRPAILRRVLVEHHGEAEAEAWLRRMLEHRYDSTIAPRIGALRAHWKRDRRVDLDALVHPTLFRVLNSYLDQGVAIWRFPVWDRGFLASLREMQRHAFAGFLRGGRAKALLLDERTTVEQLLCLLVGDPALYEQYLFDQQFAHPGWSGLVSVVEDQPTALLDKRAISLRELILFELLLEIDALDRQFPEGWRPLHETMRHRPVPLFAEVPLQEVDRVRYLWQ
ncbi:MAG: putative inorganic carbon transporter subunit DabA, partial [Flavobacteriales bacterium]